MAEKPHTGMIENDMASTNLRSKRRKGKERDGGDEEMRLFALFVILQNTLTEEPYSG
jgi:hypothetical protein